MVSEKPQPVEVIVDTDLDIWMPTITFLLGVAIGGCLVLTYMGWVI